MIGIHDSHRSLRDRWASRFRSLPQPARDALRNALYDLRHEALDRAQLSWVRHKAPMAYYWKVVAVYAGHLARTLKHRGTADDA